ncbi:cytochrome b5 [Stylonychia lemnae]|uniref:Cytochrome b5 n=1 Tax=Stylonychia lemnae TaxID=5949 RepID=A0A078AF75_STYLE|nr:cytochrome b5 [Stylonychia lemnae]|eukprot:CDW80177.1 cytochrome b5 [Stylonychia lemnae]
MDDENKAQQAQDRQITKDEITAHSAEGDCWLLIEGKVYDVSPYMDKHPGGSDILLANASGQDASEAYEDADHSKRAKEMLKKYFIGVLAQ